VLYKGNEGLLSESEAETSDLYQALVGILYLGMFIATIVAFVKWFRRAYNNIHALNKENLEYSENQALWSWFIPFINLVRPKRIMEEIWDRTQKSYYVSNTEYTKSALISWWWGFWII